MTLKDAAARLEALAFREDSDCAVPASMLPLDVAIEITSEAFAAGMNGATP
jgi:hypothetical protein